MARLPPADLQQAIPAPRRPRAAQLVEHPDGVWGLRRGRLFARRSLQPALFLDRDGVIVEEVDHLHRPEDVRLLDGAAALIRRANELRLPVIVITNQAGVGRGMYDWAAFLRVTAAIDEALAREGARIDAIYACPFHREGIGPYQHPNHPARKPNAGMFHRAAEECRIDLGRSWFIGDHAGDILAARAGGLHGAIHLLTGHGADHRERVLQMPARALRILVASDLDEAFGHIPLLAGPVPATGA